MTLPRWMYGDPARVLENKENRTCKGCKHINKALGREFCMKMRPMDKRCKHYDA